MSKKSQHSMTQQSTLTFLVVGIVLIIWAMSLFPFHRLESKELLDNPGRARYYITLQSILANYTLLATDKANVTFIKHRLMQFEHDAKHAARHHGSAVAGYHQQYRALLQTYGVKSIKNIKKKSTIIDIAKKAADNIDGFYLDARLFRQNPLYSWQPQHQRRILQYNLGGLFNEMPNRYMRILAAYTNDSQLGVYSGFFVNNQTTTMETQFMTGMPMLTALYVMPKYDYNLTGSLDTMVPWGYFGSHSLVDPVIRKVLDISGIDVFSVIKSQMASKQITEIPGASAFNPDIHPSISTDYVPYLNLQSYGMAYLANQITFEDPAEVRPLENAIKNYFSQPINHNPKIFTDTTNLLYGKLMALKEKHDIILEKPAFTADTSIPAGQAVVKGIVGERVLLDSFCQREHCTLVLNIADAPGWHAFVNGSASEINRANFAFMATEVPAGYASVWFIYSPLSSVISYLLSITTLLGLLMACRRTH